MIEGLMQKKYVDFRSPGVDISATKSKVGLRQI